MPALTKRQEEILNFIAQRIEEEGSPPTLRELARHIETLCPYSNKFWRVASLSHWH